MTPFAVAQLVFAPRSAAMVTRFGPKAVCAVGMALVTLGLGGFVLVGAATPRSWVVGLLFFIQGVGMANVMPPATESIMSTLPREKAGVGSAVQQHHPPGRRRARRGDPRLGALRRVPGPDRQPASQACPAPQRDLASSSVSGTYTVAGQAWVLPGRAWSPPATTRSWPRCTGPPPVRCWWDWWAPWSCWAGCRGGPWSTPRLRPRSRAWREQLELAEA